MIQQQCIPTEACLPQRVGSVSQDTSPSCSHLHLTCKTQSDQHYFEALEEEIKLKCVVFFFQLDKTVKQESKLTVGVSSSSISQRYRWKMDSKDNITSMNMAFICIILTALQICKHFEKLLHRNWKTNNCWEEKRLRIYTLLNFSFELACSEN